MYKDLPEFYDHIQNKLLSECTRCGKCVPQCKVTGYYSVSAGPSSIQQDILGFLRGYSELTDNALAKLNACMKCFRLRGHCLPNRAGFAHNQ